MPKQPSDAFFKKDVMNSQENICARISFLVFSCEFCETCNITSLAEQHWTTASEYNSISCSEGSTVLVNETVTYDTKTKAFGLISTSVS